MDKSWWKRKQAEIIRRNYKKHLRNSKDLEVAINFMTQKKLKEIDLFWVPNNLTALNQEGVDKLCRPIINKEI